MKSAADQGYLMPLASLPVYRRKQAADEFEARASHARIKLIPAAIGFYFIIRGTAT